MRRPLIFLSLFLCSVLNSQIRADNTEEDFSLQDIMVEKKINSDDSTTSPLIQDYESYILVMTESGARSIQLDVIMNEYARIKGDDDIRGKMKVRLFEFGESFSDESNKTIGNFIVFEVDSNKIVSFTLLSEDSIFKWGLYNFINIPTTHMGFRVLKFDPDFEFHNSKDELLLLEKRINFFELDLPTPFLHQKLTESGSVRIVVDPRLTWGVGFRKNEVKPALQKNFHARIKDAPDIYAHIFKASLHVLFLLGGEENAADAWKMGTSASIELERAKQIHQRNEFDLGFVIQTPELQTAYTPAAHLEFRYDFNDFNLQTYIGKESTVGKHPKVMRLRDFSGQEHRLSFGIIFNF